MGKKKENSSQNQQKPDPSSKTVGQDKSPEASNGDKPNYFPCKEAQVNWLNRLMFYWTSDLISRGNNHFMRPNDLFDIQESQKFEWALKHFTEYFTRFHGKKGPRTGKALIYTNKWLLFWSMVFQCIGNLLQFAGPLCLSKILNDLSNPYAKIGDAYIWSSVLLGCYLIRSFLTQHGFHLANYNALTTVAAVQGSVFQKVLKMKNSARKYYDTGKVLTLTTVDSFALYNFILLGNYLITAPLLVVVASVLICLQVGVLGLIAPAVLLISMLLQNKVQAAAERIRKRSLFYNDKRSKALSEFITGIRIIKFYGWEKMVLKKVQEIRKFEAGFIFKTALIRAVTELLSSVVPIVISILIFALYQTVLHDELTPAKAYSVLSLFNLIQVPLRLLAMVLVSFANARVSMKRVGHFLTAEEYDNYVMKEEPEMDVGDIEIREGTFAWDTESARLHFKKMQSFQRVGAQGGKPGAQGGKPGAQGGKPGASTNNSAGGARGENKQGTTSGRLENNPASPRTPEGATLQPRSPEKKGKESQKPPVPADKPLKQEDLIVLRNINFSAKKGSFIGIIGQVGTGKTSLLHAILGELDKVNGSVKSKGSVAYISQQAFLRSATVRSNITFKFPFEETRYHEILQKCELIDDINILPGGDLTEIGERGINLSGGQKQRVSIARAVYADADIYVIDDCLSALDMHVGGRIYKNVLRGMLKDRTIIFVTHALHYIENVDYLYIMKDGSIAEHGTPLELRARPDSEFNSLSLQIKKESGHSKDETVESGENKSDKKEKENELIEEILANGGSFTQDEIQHSIAIERVEGQTETKRAENVKERLEEEIITTKKIKNKEDNTKKVSEKEQNLGTDTEKKQAADNTLMKKGVLLNTEVAAQGAVSRAAWIAYMASGTWTLTIAVFCTFALFQGAKVVNDWWVGAWSQGKFNLQSYQYIYIYAIVGLVAAALTLLKGIFYGYFTKRSAQRIQVSVLWSVLRSPISWFDVTPTGRIINRTNKDQDDIDQLLPWTLQFSIQNILMIISSIIMIGVILPLFFALAAVCIIAYIWWLKKYIKASREMKRIENISRSPLVQLVSEAANGPFMIRSFNATTFYIQDYTEKFNRFLIAAYNGLNAQRWIGIRTEMFGDAIIAGACYFGALSKSLSSLADSALVGLAISYALQIVGTLSFTVKMIGDCEIQMSSFERLLEYKNKKELEADFDSPTSDAGWPPKGQYEISNISYQYRPGLPHVLHNISFSIQQHEKIGVVGRTGSGKSTLTLGLLRILEVVENEGVNQKGSITLDNQNIASLGLHELRKKITIIPQDPTLFTGTIRFNIDPFNEFSDEKIIDGLKKVHMWNALKEQDEPEPLSLQNPHAKKEKSAKQSKKLKKSGNLTSTEENQLITIVTDRDKEIEGVRKLNMVVEDGGSNFSLGQRQLLCMARALIRDSRVLLMDEATASIDEKTDRLLQTMIKTEFKNTTVITIAHRLNTIVQYDKILVLENGNIAQFDTPLNLLDQEGIFSSLIKSNGPEFEMKMRDLAMNKDKDL